MEAMTNFILGGFKITADGDRSHGIKTLVPWKESYDKPSILKSRGIILPTKVCPVKVMIFSSEKVKVARSYLTLCNPMDL